jgi:hypothetical protein
MDAKELMDCLEGCDPAAPVHVAWSAEAMNGGFVTEPVTSMVSQGGRAMLYSVSQDNRGTTPRIRGMVTVAQLRAFLADLPTPAQPWALYYCKETKCTHTEEILNAFPFDGDIWLTTPSWVTGMMTPASKGQES